MRERVEERAQRRCEYCHAPQGICAYTFHIDHIVPRAKGGANALTNYALACFACNNAKRDHVTGLDPETRKEVPLFNPRRQKWEDHLAFSCDYSQIQGRTPTGRATIKGLKMNERLQVKARPL